MSTKKPITWFAATSGATLHATRVEPLDNRAALREPREELLGELVEHGNTRPEHHGR